MGFLAGLPLDMAFVRSQVVSDPREDERVHTWHPITSTMFSLLEASPAYIQEEEFTQGCDYHEAEIFAILEPTYHNNKLK